MRKLKNRNATSSGNNRRSFHSSLDQLWDIGADDAFEAIQNNRLLMSEAKQEDIQFCIDQMKESDATILVKTRYSNNL